jgi:hypothetical protein
MPEHHKDGLLELRKALGANSPRVRTIEQMLGDLEKLAGRIERIERQDAQRKAVHEFVKAGGVVGGSPVHPATTFHIAEKGA